MSTSLVYNTPASITVDPGKLVVLQNLTDAVGSIRVTGSILGTTYIPLTTLKIDKSSLFGFTAFDPKGCGNIKLTLTTQTTLSVDVGSFSPSGSSAGGAASAPALSSYNFCSAAGTITMNGAFLNTYGQRVGNIFHGSFDTSALKTFADIYGAALPTGAVGVMFTVTGDAKFGLSDTSGAAPSLSDVLNYGIPWFYAYNPFTVGRVG